MIQACNKKYVEVFYMH